MAGYDGRMETKPSPYPAVPPQGRGSSAIQPGARAGWTFWPGRGPARKGRNEMAANALKTNDLAKCLISRPNDFKDLRQASRNRWFRLAKDSFRFCCFWPPRSAKRNGRPRLRPAAPMAGEASSPRARQQDAAIERPIRSDRRPVSLDRCADRAADALARLPDEAKKVAQKSSQSPEIIGARNIVRAAYGISMPSSKRVLAIVS